MPHAITVQKLEREIKEIKKHMVTREEIEELIADKELMESIKRSEEDFKAGRFKKVENASDLL